jgi:hypothetical protein
MVDKISTLNQIIDNQTVYHLYSFLIQYFDPSNKPPNNFYETLFDFLIQFPSELQEFEQFFY